MLLRRASSQQLLCDLSAAGPVGITSAAPSTSRLNENLRKSKVVSARMQRKKSPSRKAQSGHFFAVLTHLSAAEPRRCSKRPGNHDKLLLLNLLAAVFGLGNVVSGFVDVGGSSATLTSALKYASAAFVFLPFLMLPSSEFKRDPRFLLRSGLELGLLNFAHSILASSSPSSTGVNETSLLYTMTVFVIPLLQLYAGGSNKATWTAILLPLTGMGLLEEESNGWKGVTSSPPFENSWAITEAAVTVLQLIRSEKLTKKHNPIELAAIQMLFLSFLHIVSELSRSNSLTALVHEAEGVDWCLSVLSGLVCIGLTSLVEMRGLRGVNHSSMAVSNLMIPIWGAFFSLVLQQGRTAQELSVLSAVVFSFARVCAKLSSRLQRRARSKDIEGVQRNGGIITSQLSSVILSSQLKYPFYTNQAQALLTDMNKNFSSHQVEKLDLQSEHHVNSAGDLIHVLVTLTTKLNWDTVVWSVSVVQDAAHKFLTIFSA